MRHRTGFARAVSLIGGLVWFVGSVPASRATEMLIADRLTNSIYRYTPAGQFLGVLVNDPTNLNAPTGIQISPDRTELYVSSSNNSEVVRYDYNYQAGSATNPTVIATGNSGLSFPSSIAFNSAGNTIYVSNLNYSPPSGGVVPLTPSGASAGPALVGGSIDSYSGLALAPDGALVVGGFNDATGSKGGVLKSDAAITSISDLVAPTTSLSGVAGLMTRGNDVYVTAGFSGRVAAYNLTTGALDPAFTPITGLGFPASITLAADGQSLLVATLGFAAGGGKIARYSLTGQFLGTVATPQTDPNAGFEEPTAIVMVSDGTPVSESWITNVDGLFGIGSNWATGQVPNGQGITATFGSISGAGPTINVTVNKAFTAGSLAFDDSSVSYTLAGDGISGHALTLDNGASGAASIIVSSGSHAISAPLDIANGLTVALSADPATNIPALTISGSVSGAGRLRKMGPGTLVLGATNSYTGGAEVAGGTLRTTARGALGSTAGGAATTIDASAMLELAGDASTWGTVAPADRPHIIDYGTLLVSGIDQIAGSVDGGNQSTLGLGTLVFAPGSSLQVDSLMIQSISVGNGSMLTIAASDSSGNPLDSPASLFDFQSPGEVAATVPEPSGLAILASGGLAIIVGKLAMSRISV
ncbi:MAG TPA: SMP-30/gluconolactonase/LRE family protein [Pirellulales bacterium]|jgi:autotransporter-associated beta strand protein|nr:SMP-30/gluconolactonase/LRE family protein [Pirellulales bacterium]